MSSNDIKFSTIPEEETQNMFSGRFEVTPRDCTQYPAKKPGHTSQERRQHHRPVKRSDAEKVWASSKKIAHK